MIKKIVLLFSIIVILFSCEKNTLQYENRPAEEASQYKYSVIVVDSITGEVIPEINFMVITENEDILGKCNKFGIIEIETKKPIKSIICACLGRYGFVNLDSRILNSKIKISNFYPNKLIRSTRGTYGVYSTDNNGDVSFRYQGNFQNYYCTSSMPSYLPGVNPLFQNTNPNTWDGWNLTDWLPTWKGKKLLVPKRCQWFHQQTYGYSISQALFMTTN